MATHNRKLVATSRDRWEIRNTQKEFALSFKLGKGNPLYKLYRIKILKHRRNRFCNKFMIKTSRPIFNKKNPVNEMCLGTRHRCYS